MQLVISAFPGSGKSTISNNAEQYGLKKAFVSWDEREGVEIMIPKTFGTPVFDSDSSIFPKDGFPNNYVEHIKGLLRDYPDCVIMVSSHDNVREALRNEGIDYILVYPQRELKGDYLERYEQRGSPEAFIKLMDDKWNDFIDSCESDPSTSKRVLSEGEYLVDKIEELKKFWPKPATVAGNEAFPTAVISGNESIGDIVTDGNGTPVACWGANGLEPLTDAAPAAPITGAVDTPSVGDTLVTSSPAPGTTPAAIGTVVEKEVTIVDNGAPGQVTVQVETEVQPAPGTSPQEVANAIVEQSSLNPGTVEVEVKPNGVVEVEASQTVTAQDAIQAVAAELPDNGPASNSTIVVEGGSDTTAAIFAAVLDDAPAPEPTVAPAPAVVDLVQLNASDIPVVGAVDAPEVAAVVIPEGANTADVVDVKVGIDNAPVSGEAVIAGNEDNSGDVVVDVNQNTGDVVVETPEGSVTVSGDEVTIDGKGIELTGAADELVQTDATKEELIELKLDMQNDIDAIEPVITMAKTEEHAGNESFADGSGLLKEAAAEALTKYDRTVEPTIGGLESFLGELKQAQAKIEVAIAAKTTDA